MKILTRGINEVDRKALAERGHGVINLPEETEAMAVLSRIAGSNALVFDSTVLDEGDESFYFGIAIGLDKDVVVITYGERGVWSEIPSVRKFATFENFLEKVEGGRL